MTTTETRVVTTRRIRRGPLVYATAATVVLMAWPAQARIEAPEDTGERANAASSVSSCAGSEAAGAEIAPPQVLGRSGTPDRVRAGHGWLMR